MFARPRLMMVTVWGRCGQCHHASGRYHPVRMGSYPGSAHSPFGQARCCTSGRKAVAVGRNRARGFPIGTLLLTLAATVLPPIASGR